MCLRYQTDTGSRKRKYRSKQSKIKINLDISHQQNLRYKVILYTEAM